jgi:hypothetical protein
LMPARRLPVGCIFRRGGRRRPREHRCLRLPTTALTDVNFFSPRVPGPPQWILLRCHDVHPSARVLKLMSGCGLHLSLSRADVACSTEHTDLPSHDRHRRALQRHLMLRRKVSAQTCMRNRRKRRRRQERVLHQRRTNDRRESRARYGPFAQ